MNTQDISNTISISKVGPDITALTFNDRGGLMAYADNKGEIKFKEITKRLYVQNYTNHTKAVYALEFVNNSTTLVAGGDDMNLSVLDFTNGSVVVSINKAHSDYIRALQTFKQNTSMFMSSSFDKTIKLFDIRENHKQRLVFNHGAEVEDIKLFNNDLSVVSVGDKYTKVFDVRNNSEAVVSLCNNIKTVNCCYVSEAENRLYTSSVDSHLKVYDMTEFKLVNQVKYSKPIVSFTFTPDMSHFGIALADGSMTVTKNKEKESVIDTINDSSFLMDAATNEVSMNYKYFFRGIYNKKKDNNTDAVIEQNKSIRLSKYDYLLR